ncbi:hypothetical protein [Roseomonas acroporae]|nr:hypothetical protein [Roseomonas acroporae]
MASPRAAGIACGNGMNVLRLGAGVRLESMRAFNEKRSAEFAR